MLSKLEVLLLAGLICSCLLLVQTAYESRRLFTQIDRAKTEQGRLDSEFKRLEADRQAQSTHLRVEQVAREKLKMRTATAAVTQFVEDKIATGAGQ